jgi:predicted SAM-dependent methyltransferase
MLLKDKVQHCIENQIPIRLHLGCGPVKLPNYLNVDGEYCSGDPEIIIHDIADVYPIPDNSVDEILSVHVIEHIERWKILPMLVEWRRILCPGAQVAVEWPDLLKACTFIAENPDSLISDDRRILKKTINSIFGNSRYQNRAMMHAYGYSVASMTRLFSEAGFSTVRSENNIYAKTASDSRVIGIK